MAIADTSKVDGDLPSSPCGLRRDDQSPARRSLGEGGRAPSELRPRTKRRPEVAVHQRRPTCRHCGAPLLDARMRETGFCCAGCAYVFRLVHEHGLAGYYRLKDEVTAPADAAVFQPRDYAWLETAQREAEAVGQVSDLTHSRIPELALDLQGITCVGCVWLIERVFQQQPGARDINVNAQYGTMRLRWVRGEFSAADFARKLQAFGYLAGPAGETIAEPESRGLVKRIGLCAAFAMNVMLFSLPVYFGMERTYEWAGLFGLLSLAFGTLSLLVGGTYFLGRAVLALRERAMHIDLPIAIGIAGAYAGSLYGWIAGEERFIYFDFVSAFILLMLVGRWAQVAAVERNRRRLLSQQPKPQRVRLADGTGLAPELLRAGHVFILPAGHTVPVEARLETAEAAFSLASINGEAEPRLVRAGQRVPAGAVSVNRREMRLTALQGWDESLLAQLLQPGERAGERHLLLERVVRGYLIGIIGVAVLSGIAWWFATGDALRTWSVVTAILVVSCPCAVGLAFPLADEMATVALRRRGVFVREGDLWSKLSRVRKLVFDKTGTLTLEMPVLQNPGAIAALDAPARAALLALVRDTPHPTSQCLLENLLAAGATETHFGEAIETVGYGVEIGPWSLGRPGWRTPANDPESPTGRPNPAGHDAEFAHDGNVFARFHFVDTARPDARIELAALAARGFTTHILSGDRQEKVTALAIQLGLDPACALGALTPQAKAEWLDAQGAADALMLGDGANDSLAFDRALCRGTPVIHRGVLERKADFYYLGRGIGGVRALFEVDVIRRRTQIAILIFSVVYNVLAVGLAVAGKMNPLVAAVLMPINSLLSLAIVIGGLRPAFSGK
ncbi:MAG: heavy metal translocating P-type ATPase metal-binding domain-containing protein [Verrucomicrobia bacterium]|nr:heavy metal translocating P-type ATPase metal-binding domain-containing protein [Verrucomicrobiota bacterium]